MNTYLGRLELVVVDGTVVGVLTLSFLRVFKPSPRPIPRATPINAVTVRLNKIIFLSDLWAGLGLLGENPLLYSECLIWSASGGEVS